MAGLLQGLQDNKHCCVQCISGRTFLSSRMNPTRMMHAVHETKLMERSRIYSLQGQQTRIQGCILLCTAKCLALTLGHTML
jgi:hypothetical protein